MDKDYRDRLEDSIGRLQDKLETLDPTSDEYRKVNSELEKQYRLKIEEAKNEADVKLRERHEENEEIMSEREYEETLKKNRNEKIFAAIKIGVEAGMFAVGMAFREAWGNKWLGLEVTGTASNGGLRDFFRNLVPGKYKD